MAAGFAQWGNDLYSGKRSYNIVGRRSRWFILSGTLVALAVTFLLVRGLNAGIEFRGGSQFLVSNVKSTSQQIATDAVLGVERADVPLVSSVGNNSVRVQTGDLTADQVTAIRSALASGYGVDVAEVTSTFIGPSWGQDVSQKAVRGLIVFMVLVALVMTLYFRDWRMAVSGLVALVHDLILTVGVYAAVGFEVTPAGVIGLLTILGYSIYDTVVVFDKVRENTAGVVDQKRHTYAELANLALNQTLVRSINTSVVALLPVASILFIGAFLLGAGTLRDIALALFVGMIAGTFSSIFLATPLQVALRGREANIAAHTAAVLQRRVAEGLPVKESGVPLPVMVTAAPLHAGEHRGTAAQPKRKKRRSPPSPRR